jgi:membrane-associated phospholipid phosphatase
MSPHGSGTRLTAADVLVIAFTLLLAVLTLASPVPHGPAIVAIDALGLVSIGAVAALRERRVALALIHDWYVAPVIFLLFKQVHVIVSPWHLPDRDAWLMAADRWLFGGDPTRWLAAWSTPVVTELLQIAYTSFYFLFLVVGYELYTRRPRRTYRAFAFTCAYGFFATYVGYALVPAVGPRFTLHDFAALDRELPGLWATPALRWFVNAGGSIAMHVPNAVAAAGAQRDVFPSGHTAMTIVLAWTAWRDRLRAAPLLVLVGALVVVAALYLRYHYVVDIIAGTVTGLAILVTAPALYDWLLARLDVLDRDDIDGGMPAAAGASSR